MCPSCYVNNSNCVYSLLSNAFNFYFENIRKNQELLENLQRSSRKNLNKFEDFVTIFELLVKWPKDLDFLIVRVIM